MQRTCVWPGTGQAASLHHLVSGVYAEIRHLGSCVSSRMHCGVQRYKRTSKACKAPIWPALVRLQGLCRSSVQIPGESFGFTRQARPEARVVVNRGSQALSGRPSDFAAQGKLPPDMFSRTSETSVLRGCNAGY